MLAFYLWGVLIVFVINIVSYLFRIAEIFSTVSRNLAKIGIYYNPTNGAWTEDKPSGSAIFWGIILSITIEALLSWINVAFIAWNFIVHRVNKAPIPEKAKELRWKLATADLPKETMKGLKKEILDFYGVKETDDMDAEENVFVSAPGAFYNEFSVYPSKGEYEQYYHTEDYLFITHSRYKYRIEGTKVLSSMIEEIHEHAGEPKKYYVKDGVVLESEIISKSEGRKIALYSADEELEKYKKEVEWSEIDYNELKYFLLARTPEALDSEGLRVYLRQELERIKGGVLKIEELFKKNELETSKSEDEFSGQEWLQIADPNNIYEKDEKKWEELTSDKTFNGCGISRKEFERSLEIKKCLLNLLGEKGGEK